MIRLCEQPRIARLSDPAEWTLRWPLVTTLTALLDRLERSYDAIPRVGGARAEPVGPFELFLREGPGWPYYARPRLGTTVVTVDDVRAVLARQRERAVPEAIE